MPIFTCRQVTAANINSGAASDGQVLTADGAGGSAWEAGGGGSIDSVYAVSGAIKLTGAVNTALNQIYVPDGTSNGKTKYKGVTDALGVIQWFDASPASDYWQISYDSTEVYLSYDAVATPDLITNWYVASTVSVSQNAGSLFMLAAGWANEWFYPSGTSNGKPLYTGAYFSGTIEWVDAETDYWAIKYGGDELYTSTENVATPNLVVTWNLGTGSAPAPVFSATEILSVAITDYPESNGYYVKQADPVNGKSAYSSITGSWTLQWSGTEWQFIDSTSAVKIISFEDVATPDLVVTWWKDKLLTVIDYTNYPAGSRFIADGSGGTQWNDSAGVLVSWTTNSGIGEIKVLYAEILAAAGLVGTDSLKKAKYFIAYSDGLGGDALGALWYEAGESNTYSFQSITYPAIWPSGTCKLLGVYADASSASWTEAGGS